MITKLNLSSRPFRNRTLPWAITFAVCLFSLIALAFIMNKSWATTAQANNVEKEVQPLRKEKKDLEEKAKIIHDKLSPEQRMLLSSSHSLVNRKRFSWSYLFNELETVVPNNVKVSRVDVSDIYISNGRMVAELEFAVVSKTDTSVTGMMSEMNRTGVFQTELIGQDLRKEDNENVTEWTMHVIYMQRVGLPVNQSADNTTAQSVNGGAK